MTIWADVSQYQGAPVDDRYPHRIFCFRTNSGDRADTLADENAVSALDMLRRGRLDVVLPYYFFRPGQANCDLHRQLLEQSGLWGHPATATMIDVEDAGGQIRGDQSLEVNGEFDRLAAWYGDRRRVIGYLNGVANGSLWQRRPGGMRLVTPNYTGQPGVLSATVPGWVRQEMFAHQFTDKGQCPPWSGGVDLNYSAASVADIRSMLGITTGGSAMSDTDKIIDYVEKFCGPIGSDTKDNRFQLTGSRDLVYVTDKQGRKVVDLQASFPGHKQLGGRTVVDALGALGAFLGVPGFVDTKGIIKNKSAQ